MTTDFSKVLIKDDRLCGSDQISYAIHKGGQQITSATTMQQVKVHQHVYTIFKFHP